MCCDLLDRKLRRLLGGIRGPQYGNVGDLSRMSGLWQWMAVLGPVAGKATGENRILSDGHELDVTRVEAILACAPGVGAGAVVGLPHLEQGQCFVAFLERLPGHPSPRQDDVVAYLSRRLTAHEMPKAIILLDDLPRDAAGILQKNKLQREYEALLIDPLFAVRS